MLLKNIIKPKDSCWYLTHTYHIYNVFDKKLTLVPTYYSYLYWLIGKLSKKIKPCMPKSEPYSAHLMFLTTAPWLPLPSTTCCGNFWTDLKPNITTNILFNPAYKKYEPMSYYPHTYHCQVHIPHWWPYYYSFSSFPKINAATMFLIYGPFLLDTWSIL